MDADYNPFRRRLQSRTQGLQPSSPLSRPTPSSTTPPELVESRRIGTGSDQNGYPSPHGLAQEDFQPRGCPRGSPESISIAEAAPPPDYQHAQTRYRFGGPNSKSGSSRAFRLMGFSQTKVSRNRRSIPIEVIDLIAKHTVSISLLATLARLNKELYDTVIPYLYYSVPLDRYTATSLFWGLELPVNENRFVYRPTGQKVVQPNAASCARKRRALNYVKEVIMDDVLCDTQTCVAVSAYAAMVKERQSETGRRAGEKELNGYLGNRDSPIENPPSVPSQSLPPRPTALDRPPPEDPPPYDPLPLDTPGPPSSYPPLPSTLPLGVVLPDSAASLPVYRLPLMPNAARLVISPDSLNGLVTWLSRHPEKILHPLHDALPLILKPSLLEINRSASLQIAQGMIHSLYHPTDLTGADPGLAKPIQLLNQVVRDLSIKLRPERLVWHAIHSEAMAPFSGNIKVEYHCTPVVLSDTPSAISLLPTSLSGFKKAREDMVVSALGVHPPQLPTTDSIFIGLGLYEPFACDLPPTPVRNTAKARPLATSTEPTFTELQSEKFRSISIQERIEIGDPTFNQHPILPLSRMSNVLFIDSQDAPKMGYATGCACYGRTKASGVQRV